MKEKSGYRIKKIDLLLFVSILLITISSSRAVAYNSIGTILELMGYCLLLLGIFMTYCKLPQKYKKKYIKKRYIFLIIILLNIGLIPQELILYRKLILIFGMITIVMISTMSEGLVNSTKSIEIMSNAVMIGIIISMLLCIVLGISLIMPTSEGTFGIYVAFNGGIKDKNIATMMIVMIISQYIIIKQKHYITKTQLIIIVFSTIVLLASNSRGAWINMLVFLIMLNYKKILQLDKKTKKVLLIMFVPILIIFVVVFYFNVILSSSTYLYRFNGLINFFKKFGNDIYRMMFGIADLVYDKENDYVFTYRALTGWNGTLEIAWVNILIKNGILGLIGFVLIYIRAIAIAAKSTNKLYKTVLFAIIVMLLASSLVATYIQNIHGLLGTYCYLLMGYLSRLIHNQSDIENMVKNIKIEIRSNTDE